jgi:hypothetical protein
VNIAAGKLVLSLLPDLRRALNRISMMIALQVCTSFRFHGAVFTA